MRELLFDEYGMRVWAFSTLILLGAVCFALLIVFLGFAGGAWQCSAWASSNPGLEIKFFWDGFMGCMVKVDGNWIDSSLVREILSLR